MKVTKVHILIRKNLGDYNHIDLFTEVSSEEGDDATGPSMMREALRTNREAFVMYMQAKKAKQEEK